MNHIKKLLILTLMLVLFSTMAFAEDTITVSIDGNPIAFETEPQMNGNTIMVPMKEFFEAMGARVLWVESERMVIAYKDNMHMKLQLGNKIAFRNGKRFMLEAEPVISDGRTLVPTQIIAETFDMKPTWDEDAKTLTLEGSDDDAGLKMFSDGIYKTKPIDELGIAISIPYHWENLEGPFQYGYQDDFESYSITLMSQSIDKTITLTELVDENKAILLDAYDEDITFTGEEVLKIDNLIDVRKLFITTTENDIKQKQVLYILKQDDTAYYMTCHYGKEVPEEDIIAVFDNIISTFKIRNLSIDSEEEHYMEFEEFYTRGVHLNQEYYSNMVVEKSEIPFSGTLDEGHHLDAFLVKVQSGSESLDFIIPITGTTFDGTIYTPFGLGKHNIFIAGIPANSDNDSDASSAGDGASDYTLANPQNTSDDTAAGSSGSGEDKDSNQTTGTQRDPLDDLIDTSAALPLLESSARIPVMQFSVINIDSRTMRYRIPTNTIRSKDVQIDSTARLLTYQVSSQYMKARELFAWMINNIAIDENTDISRSNYQVFDTAVGTHEQINQLYVAYLRALDIPARVMKGSAGTDVYFWTELYLNGSWVTSDLIEGILLKDDESAHISDYMYFNINFESHRYRYDLIQVMPY